MLRARSTLLVLMCVITRQQTCANESTCQPCDGTEGANCDDLQQFLGLTCDQLEEEVYCDCRGCSCASEVMCSDPTGCMGSPCDFMEGVFGTPCSYLEEEVGCNCDGCGCLLGKDDSCIHSCGSAAYPGYSTDAPTCDYLVGAPLDFGLSCDNLETEWGCDCEGCSQCAAPDPEEPFASMERACDGTSYFTITSQVDCEFAAWFLGLADTEADVVTTTSKPPGCSTRNQGTLVFNTDLESTDVHGVGRSGTKRVLCQAGTTDFLAMSGCCDGSEYCVIIEPELCEIAAASLGFEDTTVTVVNKPNKAPGCWQRRGGALVFNDDLNSEVQLGTNAGQKVFCVKCDLVEGVEDGVVL